MDFSSLEALMGYGAGCVSGYGFAMRVLLPSMIAAKVAPLEARLEDQEAKLSELKDALQKEANFSKRLQKKLLKIDDD